MGRQAPEQAQSLPDLGVQADTMLRQAHGRWKYPKSRLLASSVDRGWPTIEAELRSHPSGRIASPAQQTVEIVIGICGGDDALVVRNRSGPRVPSQEGSIGLAPIGMDEEEVSVTAPIPKALHYVFAGSAVRPDRGSIQSSANSSVFH